MRITYAGVEIADGGRLGNNPAWSRAVQPQTQTNGRFDADDGLALAAGARQRRWPLSVPTVFDTVREAEEFFCDWENNLPDTGTLVVTCGVDGDDSERSATALLADLQISLNGAVVTLDYVFLHEPFEESS